MTLEKQVKEMAGLQLQLDTEREEKRLLQEQLQEAEVSNTTLCNTVLLWSLVQLIVRVCNEVIIKCPGTMTIIFKIHHYIFSDCYWFKLMMWRDSVHLRRPRPHISGYF